MNPTTTPTTPEPVKHYTHPTGARLTVQGRIVQYSITSHPLLTYKAGSGPEAEGLALRMGFKLDWSHDAERGTV